MRRKWRLHLMVHLITSWIIWELELVTVKSTQDQNRGFVPIVHQRLQNVFFLLRFNFFIVFTCRPAPQLSNLFLRAEQRFVPAAPASLALPSLLGPSSFEDFCSLWKKQRFFPCIKYFRSQGRKSGLLRKHGIADKSLAWRLALRDADDIGSRLVIPQNAEELQARAPRG